LLRIYACLVSEHDIRFVGFAAGICLLSALTALVLARHVEELETSRRFKWILLTGYVTGVGIWATHFVAMLAYQPELPTAYSAFRTTLSVVVSIVLASLGWRIRFSDRRHARFEAPAVIAAGIGVMHFIGMSAMQTQGSLRYDPLFLSLALCAACLFTALALQWDGRKPMGHPLPRAFALALAICTLHFGSMAAVTVVPASGIAIPPEAVPRQVLSLGVAASVLILLILAIFAVTLDTRVRNTASEVSRVLSRDPLTGVLNTSAFDRAIKAVLNDEEKRSCGFAILRIEPGNAVDSADNRGAGMKDRLLVEIARLLGNCSGVEIIGRSSGNDFTVFLRQGDCVDDLGGAVRDLYRSMLAPIFIDGEPFRLSPCIGVSRYPEHGADWEELHHRAGFALYHARMSGRQSLLEYDPAMEVRAVEHNEMASALRDALVRGELSLAYQPIACAGNGEVLGFEALLRWQRPGHGEIPPAQFVPIAEAEGLMPEIGQWALAEACRNAAAWPNPLKVAVNLSAVQFADSDLVGKIRAALTSAGLHPSRLELEITEGLLIEDAGQALEVLDQLKRMGVRIAMDDFGTGFSSLAYFRQFPFDKVKIDQSFVRDMLDNRQSMAIVTAVIGLGRSLGLVVLAEGVETPEQLAALAAQGCHQVQGYLIGKPLAQQQYARFTSRRRGLELLSCAANCAACDDPLRPAIRRQGKDMIRAA